MFNFWRKEPTREQKMQTEEQNLQDGKNESVASATNANAQTQNASAADTATRAQAPQESTAPTADRKSAEQEATPATEQVDPQVQIATLRAQVEVLAKKSQEDRDRMLRAVAEADNARKRAEADVERERKFALEKFVKAIIPVYDSLDQALTLSNREDPATKATLDGVENTVTLLLKELKAMGVECINPQGAPFDPNQHQAISMVPSAEVPAKHVLHVMQKGFVLNGRVVRPAMVMVSQGAPAATAEAENNAS